MWHIGPIGDMFERPSLGLVQDDRVFWKLFKQHTSYIMFLLSGRIKWHLVESILILGFFVMLLFLFFIQFELQDALTCQQMLILLFAIYIVIHFHARHFFFHSRTRWYTIFNESFSLTPYCRHLEFSMLSLHLYGFAALLQALWQVITVTILPIVLNTILKPHNFCVIDFLVIPLHQI